MPPSCLSRSVLLPLPAGTAASSHTGAGSPASTAHVNGAIIVITCRRSQSGTEKFGELPNIEQHAGGGVWILKNKPPSLPGWTDKHCPPPPPSAIGSRMSPLDIGSPGTQCQCPGLPCYGARVRTGRPPRGTQDGCAQSGTSGQFSGGSAPRPGAHIFRRRSSQQQLQWSVAATDTPRERPLRRSTRFSLPSRSPSTLRRFHSFYEKSENSVHLIDN